MYPSTATSTSAKVPLPSVKVSLTIPRENNNNSRNGGGRSGEHQKAVAASLEALTKSLDRQKQYQQNPHHSDTPPPPTSSMFQNVNNNNNNHTPTTGGFAKSLAASNSRGAGMMMRKTKNSTPDNNIASSEARRNLESRTAYDLQHIQSEASMSFFNTNGGRASSGGVFDDDDAGDGVGVNSIGGRERKLQKQFVNFQLSEGVDRATQESHVKFAGGGYSSFQAALETALRKLERNYNNQQQQQEIPMEERWVMLANCLTSLDLKRDLHKVCKDIETVIEEIQKAKAYDLAVQQQQYHNSRQQMLGSGGGGSGDNTPPQDQMGSGSFNNPHSSSSMSLLSPNSVAARREREAKARLNGTQTAMAAMLLEQCLHAVGEAAPYSKPALTWLLDTVLGSIYVSYDIVRNDLSRSYEPLRLVNPTSGSVSGQGGANAEKLISRFYSKTFFQSVRSLSTAAKAHAEHAEEIERSKTRQSRVLERAISYWARYSMRRVLGAWRGFAKNEKIERELRQQVDELAREKQLLKDLNDQREKDLSAVGGAAGGGVLGTSAESLQLQVRELQRALDFERRRATRAEAALALRVVADSHNNSPAGKNENSSSADFGSNNSNGGEGSDVHKSESSGQHVSSVEVTSLRAEVAHYRAVAVEACRLGDIDLHELERAVTAQTNVLARGMY